MAATNKHPLTGPPAGFPFESRFVNVNGHRIHYVEEGEGDPMLFIHGNPTSSYLWRNILPRVARETGRRCIAMDLLGFGRSDKPGDVKYSAHLHSEIVEGFIERLRLNDIVLVLHDWGGPLGTSYAVRHPENIRGLVFMETFLWSMTWEDFGRYKTAFKLLRSPLGYVLLQMMNAFVNRVLPGSVRNKENMTEEVMRRYREPFPTVASRRAIRAFPVLLPIEGKPEETVAFIEEIERNLSGVKSPALWIKAKPGAIISENTECHLLMLRVMLPQLELKEFGPGLHYLQEDDPDKIVALIVEWIRDNNLASGKAAVSRNTRKAA